MSIRHLLFLGLLLLAGGSLWAAVSPCVRILPRTHTYTASNAIAFRTVPRTGITIIIRWEAET